jgi:hypothetical protein
MSGRADSVRSAPTSAWRSDPSTSILRKSGLAGRSSSRRTTSISIVPGNGSRRGASGAGRLLSQRRRGGGAAGGGDPGATSISSIHCTTELLDPFHTRIRPLRSPTAIGRTAALPHPFSSKFRRIVSALAGSASHANTAPDGPTSLENAMVKLP